MPATGGLVRNLFEKYSVKVSSYNALSVDVMERLPFLLQAFNIRDVTAIMSALAPSTRYREKDKNVFLRAL